jgi:glycosyltransferase involved in cell wall biosynthesis
LTRIVQFADSLATSNGGPSRNAFELNRALNRIQEVSVDLIWFRGERESSVLVDVELPPPTSARPGPRRLRAAASAAKAGEVGVVGSVRAVLKSDAVIVHGFYLPWVPAVLAVAFLLRKPVYLMPHGALTLYETGRKAGRKAAFRRLLAPLVTRTVRCLAVGSEREANDARAVLPRIRAAVCGVGTTMPSPVTPRPFTSPVRLLTLCRLAPKKRVDLAIRAVRELRDRGVAARLAIAGTGPERSALVELVDELQLADTVVFLGEVTGSSKASSYAEADIFVLPSEDENFGIVVAEALAYGVPVIASTKVEAANVAAPAAAHVIHHVDAQTIASAVEELLTTDRESISRSARAAADRHFNWDRVAARWMALVDETRSTQ